MSAPSPPRLDARGLPEGYPFKPEYEVTPREARIQFESQRAVLVDVRTDGEFDTARIAGAILIPLHTLESRLEELEEFRDHQVILHCHHGVRSMKAMLALRAHGFDRAMSMAGGIDLWSRDVDPRVPRYERDGAVCRIVS